MAAALAALAGCDITGTAKSAGVQVFTTAPVSRGSVVQSVSATGTVEPEELVDIGAQVSGKILSFGRGLEGEELDYCSQVTNGMLLAKIDDVTYVADLNVAEAQLRRARASVAVAEASLEQAKVSAGLAKREWERAQKIGVGSALSRTTYENYEAASLNADAALKTAEAQVFQAKAAVIEAEASVEKAQRNLSYCEIVSSVDGVVIDRRVNVGQTVVSSMSASSLFLVARDLSHVQVWVAVNEADIGSIRQGGRVTFTVDTFPGRTFEGTVRRTRLNATVTSNVVTYTVEVDTDNSDLTLLPYLTANVQFETARADGALVVPAKALRVRIAEPTGASDDGLAAIGAVAGAGGGDAVYVMDGGAPRRVPVKVILSNGADAAVESVGGVALAEGVEVVTGVATVRGGAGKAGASAGGGDGTGGSPFMPKMPKPPKNRAGGGPPP